MQELLLSSLYIVNLLLTLANASLAYHTVPQLVAVVTSDPGGQAAGVKNLRSLLPLLVALYVSLDCYAYSFRNPCYVGGVTVLLGGDILVQYLMGRKRGRAA